MADQDQGNAGPESQGDEFMGVVRSEVQRQIQDLMNEYMPGGVGAMMDQIVERVVNNITPLLPQVDYDLAAQKALDLARQEMGQHAEKIGAEIEAKAANMSGGGNGMGPGAPPSNNGHQPNDGHDHGPSMPAGYTFPTVQGASSWKEAVKMQMMADPLQIINFVFDKGFHFMERWHQLNKPNNIAVLRQIQQTEPELFNTFVPHPWGPEFQRMMQETYVQGLRAAKMGRGDVGGGGGGYYYDPFELAAGPSEGSQNEPTGNRRPLFDDRRSVIESSGRSIGDTPRDTMPESVTLSGTPRTMSEMLAGDL